MAIKTLILQSEELELAVQNEMKRQGEAVESVNITVNEESGEDVVVVRSNNDCKEIEIVDLADKLNKVFNVKILKYDGYHEIDSKNVMGGYLFLVA